MLNPETTVQITRELGLHNRKLINNQEVIARLRSLANNNNLHDILKVIPLHLANLLQESLVQQPVLKGGGYWRSLPMLSSGDNDKFPDPLSMICSSWCLTERSRIVDYLRTGITFAKWRGLSYCRFECGISYVEMGYRCLSDGEWVWPEGLAHYVAAHDVRLPDDFVLSMRRNGWKTPECKRWLSIEIYGLPDYGFWIEWGKANCTKENVL